MANFTLHNCFHCRIKKNNLQFRFFPRVIRNVLSQLTTLEKVGRNPQTALGKSGKVQRRTSSNGNGVGKTSAKTGTEKGNRKLDCAKVGTDDKVL